MAITIDGLDDVLDYLARRQDSAKILEKQRQLQRRNTVTDAKADFQTMLRGLDRIYTAFRISNDMQYIMKYSFNLHVRPFVTNLAQTVTTSDTSLSVSGGSVLPNPHHHTAKDGSFDVLRLLDYLHPWQQSIILSPGLKEIQITQRNNMLCECEISYYIKYNHVDRGGMD